MCSFKHLRHPSSTTHGCNCEDISSTPEPALVETHKIITKDKTGFWCIYEMWQNGWLESHISVSKLELCSNPKGIGHPIHIPPEAQQAFFIQHDHVWSFIEWKRNSTQQRCSSHVLAKFKNQKNTSSHCWCPPLNAFKASVLHPNMTSHLSYKATKSKILPL